MKIILLTVIATVLSISVTLAATEIRTEQLLLKSGKSSTTVKDKLKGYQTVDYQLRVVAGKVIVVTLTSSNLSTYFNILPPGSDTALFIGSTSGGRFEGPLPVDGLYTIRVYLMRNAARRKETTRYTLMVMEKDGNHKGRSSTVTTTSKKAPLTTGAFTKRLELQGISFYVTCANEGSINTLHIIPAGLKVDNAPISREIDGTVTGAEVTDLNVDGSPEIYVYVTSAGSGSYGSLVAFSANKLKSLSEIYLPPLSEDQAASKGYRGHDEFAVLEGVLGRRFPVYRDMDINATPTGGTRQIQYKLVPGEAGWLLKSDRVVEY